MKGYTDVGLLKPDARLSRLCTPSEFVGIKEHHMSGVAPLSFVKRFILCAGTKNRARQIGVRGSFGCLSARAKSVEFVLGWSVPCLVLITRPSNWRRPTARHRPDRAFLQCGHCCRARERFFRLPSPGVDVRALMNLHDK